MFNRAGAFFRINIVEISILHPRTARTFMSDNGPLFFCLL